MNLFSSLVVTVETTNISLEYLLLYIYNLYYLKDFIVLKIIVEILIIVYVVERETTGIFISKGLSWLRHFFLLLLL